MAATSLPAIRPRPCGSFVTGALPEGCRQCEQGAKMVLFITGLCGYHCFYCPVSDEKMYRDVVFADEMRVERDEDVLAEARAIRAKGAGITGGDPMEAMDRLCHYLRLLKKEFGPSFHTHLYTMTTDSGKIRRAAEAGLDEIRFHVPPGLWRHAAKSGFVPAVRLARELGMAVGLEVPLIPDRKDDLVELIRWAEAERLDFVNLDEMEFSEANWGRMKRQDYEAKDEMSYGVKGADDVAAEILQRPWGTTVHYCSSRYKDAWQLRTRIKRRAETGAKPDEQVTEDGTLVKGVIEADDLAAVERELRTT
ncbi:MAG: radical SAM protein, partial [Candidatus Thermoplasmatota archaeon]